MSDCCSNESSDKGIISKIYPSVLSFVLLVLGIVLEQKNPSFFNNYFKLSIYGVAYLLVGYTVLKNAVLKIIKGDIFNEFFLMGIATLGAIFLKEYAEAVAVMLFYTVGENFQEMAINRAKRSIESLLQLQIEEVIVISDKGDYKTHPRDVEQGQIIRVKSGEKVALDGLLVNDYASFNSSALTGESMPDEKTKGESVLAGMINLDKPVTIKVTSNYENTKLSKILELVQDATSRKAKTQEFITSFAKVYTPIVVALAVCIVLLPFFFVETYIFDDWLYRSLVFLVISCPCALVISIPLGYFGGIGAGSRNGILFKGSNYLDVITEIDTIVMDKTGTLTKGIFEVKNIVCIDIQEDVFLKKLAALEAYSTHPIAQAIVEHSGVTYKDTEVDNVREISGHGMYGTIDGVEILAGNERLLKKYNVDLKHDVSSISESVVFVAINSQYIGYVTIADTIKEDAFEAIKKFKQLDIKNIIVLSGDKKEVVKSVADELGIDEAFGELLPDDKVKHVSSLKDQGFKMIFVGDGINDAPALAIADVGVAMGGLGSDAAIETADVVIQNDQPSKIATAIGIGKMTKKIVLQNISLSFGVKLIVLALGAGGLATMWEAVFADVGVALLAILNAIRIQNHKYV